MLAEIEEKILRVLRQSLEALPKDGILIEARPSRLPAITIANKGFKIEKSGLSEVQEDLRVEGEELFPIDGDTDRDRDIDRDRDMDRGREKGKERREGKAYKLRHRPLRGGGLRVECPPGVPLKEGIDYFVDFDEGSIRFPVPPPPTNRAILVKYSYEGAKEVKGLKLFARYAIDVLGKDRAETDSIAEGIVKAFLSMEEELAMEGIDVRLVGGKIVREEWEGKDAIEKVRGIRLLYLFEKELRVEKAMMPIEKIEIAKKEVLKP
jgi:uncharacterized protein YwbE